MGFLNRLKEKFPGITLISSDQYAGPTRDTGKRASENLLNRYANDIQGVFCVNESSTHGMLLALRDAGGQQVQGEGGLVILDDAERS